MVGQALDSKSSVTELCLADNQLGGKGAMFAMRKAGSDVQGVNGQCGVFAFVPQTAKRPTSFGGQGKDVDAVFLFNSYPSKSAKPFHPQKNNPKTYTVDFP